MEIFAVISSIFNTSVPIQIGTGFMDTDQHLTLQQPGHSYQSHPQQNLTTSTHLQMDPHQYHSMLAEFRGTLYTYSHPQNIVLILLYVPLFLVAFVGNLLVLCVVLPNRHMRSVTNCFIVNLAIADLLVTVVCVPMAVGQAVYRMWVYGRFMCKITSYMQGVSVASSVFTITMLSVDRYMAIKHPMTFRTITAGKHAVKVVVIIWIVCFSIMVPLLLARKLDIIEDLLPGEPLYFCKESWVSDKSRQIYAVFLFLFMFVMPGYFIIMSYCQIGKQLWSENRDLCRSDSKVGKQQAEKVMAGRRKVARILVLVAVLFAVCWMPYHLLSLFIDFVHDVHSTKALDFLPFTILIGHSNSALNPILYCFMNKTFRKNTLKLLHCHCGVWGKSCCQCKRHRGGRKTKVNLVVKYRNVNSSHKTKAQTTRNPLRRIFSNSSTGSRSSGSLRFSHSSMKTTNSNVFASRSPDQVKQEKELANREDCWKHLYYDVITSPHHHENTGGGCQDYHQHCPGHSQQSPSSPACPDQATQAMHHLTKPQRQSKSRVKKQQKQQQLQQINSNDKNYGVCIPSIINKECKCGSNFCYCNKTQSRCDCLSRDGCKYHHCNRLEQHTGDDEHCEKASKRQYYKKVNREECSCDNSTVCEESDNNKTRRGRRSKISTNQSSFSCTCDCDYCKQHDYEDESSYDYATEDSENSDTFCEMCADAGLVECCHMTPEPRIRLAWLRHMNGSDSGGRGKGQSETVCVELELQNIPKITLEQYH